MRQRWMRILAGTLIGLATATVHGEATVGDGLRYVDLTPTFVTNFGASLEGRLSYVRTDVTVKVSSQAAENAVIYHTPALRNTVVLALSRQEEEGVTTTHGRDILRTEALEEIQQFLKDAEGETFVEDLLFTNFIVQQ